MRRWTGAVPVILTVVLFLIANRGAYRGYFSADDLDNISWTTAGHYSMFVDGLLAPVYYPNHFRPVGHLTFRLLGHAFGLNFFSYVVFIHSLHLVNTALLWLFLRKLGFDHRPAAFGAVFFVFPMAVFEALWKPMYLFDLWCGFFTLWTLLLYTSGRHWLGIATFWLAFKSKEHAVMLPAVLATYELLLGGRRWRWVAPYASIAVLLLVQAFLRNKEAGSEYAIRLSLEAVWTTASFYFSRVLLHPAALLILLAAVVWVRDKRALWGVASAVILLAPLLVLPARLYAAYLYVSLAMVGIAVAGVAAVIPLRGALAILAVWLGINYQSLREQRRKELTIAEEHRGYVNAILHLPARYPDVRVFAYDGLPLTLREWGVRSALELVYRSRHITLIPATSTEVHERTGAMVFVFWDYGLRKVTAYGRLQDEPDVSYLTMSPFMPVWQLNEGWYGVENRYRWTHPRATARLARPPGARRFELEVNVGPQYIQAVKTSRVEVLLDGLSIGAQEFRTHGWQRVRFSVPPSNQSTARVEFRVTPAYTPPNDPRPLGIAVAGFGFIEQDKP